MQRAIAILSCILAIGFAFPAPADQNDPRLSALFTRLHETDSRLEAQSIEQEIWVIWFTSPNDEVNKLMELGSTAMANQDFKTAIEDFTKITEIEPKFAEGWNRRATARFYAGDFEGSREDVAKTLALEPRHFGALSGLGLINAAEDKGEAAIKAWEDALKVNPNMPSVEQNIEDMKEKLAKDNI
jgi:tetratricopeptide (TPR) repeat protein